MPTIGNNNLGTIAAYDRATLDFPDTKRALCFGDSWFQYPPPPIDLNKLMAKGVSQYAFHERRRGRARQWAMEDRPAAHPA